MMPSPQRSWRTVMAIFKLKAVYLQVESRGA